MELAQDPRRGGYNNYYYRVTVTLHNCVLGCSAHCYCRHASRQRDVPPGHPPDCTPPPPHLLTPSPARHDAAGTGRHRSPPPPSTPHTSPPIPSRPSTHHGSALRPPTGGNSAGRISSKTASTTPATCLRPSSSTKGDFLPPRSPTPWSLG